MSSPGMRRGPVSRAILLGLAMCLAGLGPAACREQAPSEGRETRLRIAVSIAPQSWLVDRIGGRHVETFAILPGGESPATYQPSDAQVTEVMRSAAYFRIGVPFENGPWFRAISQASDPQVIDLRRGIELRRMEGHSHHEEEDHGAEEPQFAHAEGDDPHIWLNPRLLKVQGRTVTEALCRLDPERRGEYESALAVLEAELDGLDAALREKLAPLRGRAFVVFHPAWGYLADEYGLRQIAVEIEGKEPGDADLTRLQQEAREEGIRVVFVQKQISARSAQAVAEAIGGRVAVLDPLARDVGENLLRVADALGQSYSDAVEPDA